LAYLFCRIADTIADTQILPAPQRLQALETFREQFRLVSPSFATLEELQANMRLHHADTNEYQLMKHISYCFCLLLRLSSTDQQYIRELVLTLTQGMQMDLRCFPGETATAVRALPDMEALDQYTYYVAGIVGEFWTKIHATHLPALRHCHVQTLCQLGVNFGRGLQMTNILRDIAQDFEHGRCYIPEKSLAQYQVTIEELGHPATMDRMRPLLLQLAEKTLVYLDQAQEYILQLPVRAMRLRLSCMWPLLFGIQTVELVCRAEELLNPRMRVKMPRQAVYRTILWSLGCLLVPGLLRHYYGHLRQRLTTTLGSNLLDALP
jgi:farnesyl-diphosphate farnesyltransferase